jgi:hypothetical protein
LGGAHADGKALGLVALLFGFGRQDLVDCREKSLITSSTFGKAMAGKTNTRQATEQPDWPIKCGFQPLCSEFQVALSRQLPS